MNNDIQSLFFMMSEGCNMNCSYCFEKDKKPKMITKEVIDKSFELILYRKPKNINITFFGGEPTLNPEMIEHAMNKIVSISQNDKNLKISVSIITNGLNFTKEIYDYIFTKTEKIKNINCGIQFSFHYDEKSQLENRPAKNTLISSYNQVLENIKYTSEKLKTKYGSDTFYEKINIHPAISESDVENTFNMIKNTIDSDLATIWLVPITDGKIWRDDSIFKLKAELKKSLEYMVEKYSKGDKNAVKKLSNVWNILLNKKTGEVPCSATKSLLSVGANGQLAQCHRFNYGISKTGKVGNVLTDSFDEIYENNIAFDFKKNKLCSSTGEKCSECEIFGLCYICPALNVELTGQMNITDSSQCDVQRAFWRTFMEFVEENKEFFDKIKAEEQKCSNNGHSCECGNEENDFIISTIIDSLENTQESVNKLIESYNYLVEYCEFLKQENDDFKNRLSSLETKIDNATAHASIHIPLK